MTECDAALRRAPLLWGRQVCAAKGYLNHNRGDGSSPGLHAFLKHRSVGKLAGPGAKNRGALTDMRKEAARFVSGGQPLPSFC